MVLSAPITTLKNNLFPVGQTPLSNTTGIPQILMCPPSYFEVSYAINPWMETEIPCNVDLAKHQWDLLYQALQKAGANVHLMAPIEGLPDLVFTANAGFVYGHQAIVAHYKHSERQGEEPYAKAWFEAQGFETFTLPQGTYFEGAGDALIWQEHVLAGYFTRTCLESHIQLAEWTGLPVVSLKLEDPRFYHIDVCLCPLADGSLLYAPEALGKQGNETIEQLIPSEKRIAVTAQEAQQFACNAVNIHETILLNQPSARLVDVLSNRGFQVIPLNMSEFIKAGGSAKCLTLRVG